MNWSRSPEVSKALTSNRCSFIQNTDQNVRLSEMFCFVFFAWINRWLYNRELNREERWSRKTTRAINLTVETKIINPHCTGKVFHFSCDPRQYRGEPSKLWYLTYYIGNRWVTGERPLHPGSEYEGPLTVWRKMFSGRTHIFQVQKSLNTSFPERA